MSSMLVGFGVGLSLIVAIGAQNAFVLRQGIARQHVLAVVLVCALSDAILILAGVSGIGVVVETYPTAVTVVTVAGVVFLTVYGLTAFRRALHPSALTVEKTATGASLRSVILTSVALTWLNPHVYLDTVVFLGSVANRETGSARWWFAAGAVLGSVVWFTALGFGARFATPIFAKPVAWRVLDVVIGVVMLLIAVVLVEGLVAG
ncbi:amino acid transporter [Rhodococcus sp. Leaf7]|uniref:LysE/ArgO family amino acid transporter n=1 Tax=unclassified Rhodococcus (in: high G+C Gram-positive bacteria) TaxID=192944 RepID=UPI0006FA8789|nr:amino acid transporter [Rhodococcus sp. Leaf7]KQU42442.1 amino acid transporter [Rhodococcus sp. Leaf247]